MAFHGNKTTTTATPIIQLTDDEDLTGAIRVHNISLGDLLMQATADGTAPTSDDADWAGAIKIQEGETFVGDLATYFPGVSDAVRLWGRFDNGGTASVSYA